MNLTPGQKTKIALQSNRRIAHEAEGKSLRLQRTYAVNDRKTLPQVSRVTYLERRYIGAPSRYRGVCGERPLGNVWREVANELLVSGPCEEVICGRFNQVLGRSRVNKCRWISGGFEATRLTARNF
jgi:hypothetical protein